MVGDRVRTRRIERTAAALGIVSCIFHLATSVGFIFESAGFLATLRVAERNKYKREGEKNIERKRMTQTYG